MRHEQSSAKVVTPGAASSVSWTAIDGLDFANVKRKLMLSAPEGIGATSEAADVAIIWYRRYLKLCAKYRAHKLVPSRFIDNVWHTHILDTRAYAADCNAAFGQMLHHFPYFGMNGDADERDDAFDQTDVLFVLEFGESCKDICQHGSICDGNGGYCADNEVGRIGTATTH